MREAGVVKWFNDQKGYGFIAREGDLGDVFVHWKSIDAEGFKTLEDGERVEFDVVEAEQGPTAEKVTRL